VRWCDVDFDASLLRVRQQLSRQRIPKHLKTGVDRRDVMLASAVVRLLRERRRVSASAGSSSRTKAPEERRPHDVATKNPGGLVRPGLWFAGGRTVLAERGGK
jgi:integrase